MYSRSRQSLDRTKTQQGNVIIIAIFVIVVMGMLAVNLVRVNWSNQDTLTREFLGTQAWFLAQSGNEWALTQLFPFDSPATSAAISARCTDINGVLSTQAAQAMVNNTDLPCSAPSIVCEQPAGGENVPNELQFFIVSTKAQCGTSGGIFQVEREHEVWVRGTSE
jgi:MSHA biogenesis protein MshP